MQEPKTSKKIFNIAGTCFPQQHYMVCLDTRLAMIKEMVDKGEYFAIHRARQFGKTTTLQALRRYLANEYFVQMLNEKYDSNVGVFSLRKAFGILKLFFKQVGLPSVLLLDEVDQISNNQVFLDFLGKLRENYLKRAEVMTFQSVIIASVYDIGSLRQKIRPEQEHRKNSPWNISVPFRLDMSFSASLIQGMLADYEAEHRTGMNVGQISNQIHYYTGGYPFLVSSLCKKLDEQDYEWNEAGIRNAVRDLLKENNNLFDELIKNLQNNEKLSELTEMLVLQGGKVPFDIHNPLIHLGAMFGIYIEKDGITAVSNIIFETLILNYFTSIRVTEALTNSAYVNRQQYIKNGRLNMELVLKKFSMFIKSEYQDVDKEFIERQGRLLFLSFLRPIINGTGHYAVEPETRQNDRMDIQVFYGTEEFVVELKIRHGSKYETKGYDQLVNYLDARGLEKGYLLSFCKNKKRPKADATFSHRGYQITEVLVMYMTN